MNAEIYSSVLVIDVEVALALLSYAVNAENYSSMLVIHVEVALALFARRNWCATSCTFTMNNYDE